MNKFNRTAFAHLLGLGAMARQAENEDGDKKPAADFGDENPDDGDQEIARKKGKRAEDDDGDPDAENDDPDDGDKKPAGKKAKRAEDDDAEAEDGDDDDSKKTAKAVQADRARCAHIMAYGIKNGCAEQAFVLAFDSGADKASAIAVMKAGASRTTKGPGALANAMGQLNTPKVGVGASAELPAGLSSVAAAIIKAGQ